MADDATGTASIAEHLRTTHLTLIVACGVLLLAIWALPPRAAERYAAYTRDIALRSSFVSGDTLWLARLVAAAARQHGALTERETLYVRELEAGPSIGAKRLAVALRESGTPPATPGRAVARLILPRWAVRPRSRIRSSTAGPDGTSSAWVQDYDAGDLGPSRALLAVPRNLAQWAAMWDDLSSIRLCVLTTGGEPTKAVFWDYPGPIQRSAPVRFDGPAAATKPLRPDERVLATYIGRWMIPGPRNPNPPAVRLESAAQGDALPGLEMRVGCDGSDLDVRDRLARAAGAVDPQIARDSIAALEARLADPRVGIKDAERELGEAVQARGREVELLGLKLQASRLGFVGAMCVVLLQIYIAVHLRQLDARLRAAPDSEPVQVAWTVLYTDWQSLVLDCVTLAVMPCAVVVVARWPGEMNPGLAFLVGLLSATAGVWILRHVRRIKRYPPSLRRFWRQA